MTSRLTPEREAEIRCDRCGPLQCYSCIRLERDALRAERDSARVKLEIARDGIKFIHNELGFPRLSHTSPIWRAAARAQEALAKLEIARGALDKVLIKVDWNSDEFSDLKQYKETREIILKAIAQIGEDEG